jgi:2-methylisocitrate lyase-like PEP mutase family enzyme
MPAKATNSLAKAFKALHVPGRPLLLTNVHDANSARFIASLAECKAIATASFSVAKTNGTEDAKLDLDTQLKAVHDIAEVAQAFKKPLTVDLQDGYGNRLEEAVKKMIDLGVVGINIEDSDVANQMIGEDDAIKRIKRVLATASDAGVPDFVVNARSDTYLRGGTLDEAIRRGKAYIDAGATSIYLLGGGPNGLTRGEVEKMVNGLQGRVNVGLRIPKDGDMNTLSSKDFGELGISRISIGPQLYMAATEAMKKVANIVFAV